MPLANKSAVSTVRERIQVAYERLQVECALLTTEQMKVRKGEILVRTNLTSKEANCAYDKLVKDRIVYETKVKAVTELSAGAGKNWEGYGFELGEDNSIKIIPPKAVK